LALVAPSQPFFLGNRRLVGLGVALPCSFAFLAPLDAFLGNRRLVGLGFALPCGLALLASLDALLSDCRLVGLSLTLPCSLALLAPLDALLGDRRLIRLSALSCGFALLAPLDAFLCDRRLIRLGLTLPCGLAFLAPPDGLLFLGDCRPLWLGFASSDVFALPAPLHPLLGRRLLPFGALAPWLFRAGSLLLLALCSPSLLPAQQFFLFGRQVLRQKHGCGEWSRVL
jgi:hypothetical protein